MVMVTIPTIPTVHQRPWQRESPPLPVYGDTTTTYIDGHQFLGCLELLGHVIACFGKNWMRLTKVKQRYDSTNFFRSSFWLLNDKGEVVEPQESSATTLLATTAMVPPSPLPTLMPMQPRPPSLPPPSGM
ncbi:hypothetical protein SCLCIDRAFT_10273 [Scleroderma citrinum Foug A]|uniref:Berberine/berberine-like domain-containing protein n=1 Tax=Scleroderma citrinum Foug A TaxID=1036808 RepID=A0A0C3DQK5_9AGAM|nr:hypothetical protein SCLCIDRAFT_10273 [Scleroderma citrinum Foug A]